jgi:putative phosphoesterase
LKIGVLSDTHLIEVDFRLREIVGTYFADTDMIIHAGDLISMDVLRYLQSGNLEAVRGNMDYPEVREILPDKKLISAGPFRIGIIHGWGSPYGMEERIQTQFENVHCIVFGHTHNHVNRWKDGVLFFNPGSPTDKRYAKQNSIGILEIGEEIRGQIIIMQ